MDVAGDSDGWGPDDRASNAPPIIAFQKGGVFLPPPVDRCGPVDGNDTVRIRSGRVIGVISEVSCRFEALPSCKFWYSSQ